MYYAGPNDTDHQHDKIRPLKHGNKLERQCRQSNRSGFENIYGIILADGRLMKSAVHHGPLHYDKINRISGYPQIGD